MRKRCARRKFLCGQAVVMVFAGMIFTVLLLMAAFNISQTTHSKAQTMNAADAGAYALANAVARDMNFLAYTNRAMVANHAVIGQLTTLGSLAVIVRGASGRDIGRQPYSGMRSVNEAIQQLNPTTSRLGSASGTMMPSLKDMVEGHNILITGLATMQSAVHQATADDIAGERSGSANVVEKVITANDPELSWIKASVLNDTVSLDSNLAFLRDRDRYSGKYAMRKTRAGLREIVRDARDGFTTNRSWSGIGIGLGGTDLSRDGTTWQAIDTLQMPVGEGRNRYWLPFWTTGEITGSGRISYAESLHELDHGNMLDYIHQTGYTNRNEAFRDAYSGLMPYSELADPRSQQSPPAFHVLVARPVNSADTPSANEVLQTSGMFRLDEGRRLNIYGIAASEIYFERPTARDGDRTAGNLPSDLYPNGTYPSLFSPYWQARLRSVDQDIARTLTSMVLD